MILKVEPCLVVSIQNQVTLCVGTVIVRQIPVARKLKTIIWQLCCTCIVNFIIIMNSLFKLFEILAWIIQSGRLEAKKNKNK